MEENVLDIYTDKLLETDKPALVLNQLYYSLFNLEYSNSTIWLFSKLVKVYGRQRVLLALIETYSMEKVEHKNFYGLLRYFLKKEMERTTIEPKIIDTKDLQKSLKKKKKLVIKEIFSE